MDNLYLDILKSNKLTSNYLDVTENNGFGQIIKQPTRIASTSESRLDHFVVNDFKVKSDEVLQNVSFSDYSIILFDLPHLNQKARTQEKAKLITNHITNLIAKRK